MCNERNHSICFTTTTYQVHTFKNKNKKNELLRDTFVYHFLVYLPICRCKFVIIKTRAYDMMRTQ